MRGCGGGSPHVATAGRAARGSNATEAASCAADGSSLRGAALHPPDEHRRTPRGALCYPERDYQLRGVEHASRAGGGGGERRANGPTTDDATERPPASYAHVCLSGGLLFCEPLGEPGRRSRLAGEVAGASASSGTTPHYAANVTCTAGRANALTCRRVCACHIRGRQSGIPALAMLVTSRRNAAWCPGVALGFLEWSGVTIARESRGGGASPLWPGDESGGLRSFLRLAGE